MPQRHHIASAHESVAVVADGAAQGGEVRLEADRLRLGPWRVAEALIQRETWLERDARVPAQRHIDANGRPTIADFEEAIRTNRPSSLGLLAVERKASGFRVPGASAAGIATVDLPYSGVATVTGALLAPMIVDRRGLFLVVSGAAIAAAVLVVALGAGVLVTGTGWPTTG